MTVKEVYMSDNSNSGSNPNTPKGANVPSEGVNPNASVDAAIASGDFDSIPESQITPEIARKIIAAREAKGGVKEAAKEVQSQRAQPKVEEGAVKEAAQEAKRKFKIDDEEVDEDEVLKVYKSRKDHQREANKRLQDGQAARKQAEQFISMMRDKGQLMEVIKKLGHDPRKLAEEYLIQQLEEEKMDPREKEFRDAKAKLRQYEEDQKRQLEEVQQRRLNQLKEQYKADFNKQFVEALQATQVPQTRGTVAEMAKYISQAAKIGYKMTPKEAAQLVKEDIQKAQMNLIGESDGETLVRLLGEDVANKIRGYDVSKLKNPEAKLSTPVDQSRRERPSDPNKPMTKQQRRDNWKKMNR